MKVKSKAKPKSKPKSKTEVKAKAPVKPKVALKVKPVRKSTSEPKPKAKAKNLKKTIAKPGIKTSSQIALKARTRVQAVAVKLPEKISARLPDTAKPVPPIVKRVVTNLVERRKPIKRSLRINQFTFMKAPGLEHAFEVGDTVEVFCDHEKDHERIRGWIKGIVVQVDNKLVAVQFRSNVYLTDGWMVPDRILWYPLTSEHIRPAPGKKSAVKRDFIPDY